MLPSDKIALELVAGQIDLLRYSEGVRQQVMIQLNILQQDLIAKIARLDLDAGIGTEWQLSRLETILAETEMATTGTYARINNMVRSSTLDVLRVQQNSVLGIVNGALGSKLMTHSLTAEQLKVVVSDTLLKGAPSSVWWARQGEDVAQAFADQMRQGILSGESLGQLVQRIRGSSDGVVPGVAGVRGVSDGVMQGAARNAEALVRTSIITSANQTKLDLYAANDDVITGIMWVSTLDLRTTKKCQDLSGMVWDVKTYKPIGHEFEFPGPTAHWNCRSTQVPCLRSWEDMATKNKALARKLDRLPESTRASMNGQVPDKLTYDEFLKAQNSEDPASVEAFLGKRAYKAWSEEGTVESIAKVRSMSDIGMQRGNPITIDELRKKSGYDMSSPAEVRATKDRIDQQIAGLEAGLKRLAEQQWEMKDLLSESKARQKDLEALLRKKQGKK